MLRELSLWTLLVVLVSPSMAAKHTKPQATPLTVAQLEEMLSALHDKPDAEVAQNLSRQQLSNRLSQSRLLHMEAILPGSLSRQALQVLADQAAFLDLPASDILQQAAPDASEQHALLNQAIQYTLATIHSLPNFFATRETTRFKEIDRANRNEDADVVSYRPLVAVARTNVEVLYRDGNERQFSDKEHKKKFNPKFQELTTVGEFGPVLASLFADLSHGKVNWSHWEQDAVVGKDAVFRYEVPQQFSHYQISFFSPKKSSLINTAMTSSYVLNDDITGRDQMKKEEHNAPYHGEITVNPADGSILRLTMIADLDPTSPMSKSNIMVEYGPVEIGSKSYICPLKSIALTRAPSEEAISDVAEEQKFTHLNEVLFKQYHVFRAQSRIVIPDSLEEVQDAPSTTPDRPTTTPAQH